MTRTSFSRTMVKATRTIKKLPTRTFKFGAARRREWCTGTYDVSDVSKRPPNHSMATRQANASFYLSMMHLGESGGPSCLRLSLRASTDALPNPLRRAFRQPILGEQQKPKIRGMRSNMQRRLQEKLARLDGSATRRVATMRPRPLRFVRVNQWTNDLGSS
jgi:hypothetical protein